jgi:hypothetical protein
MHIFDIKENIYKTYKYNEYDLYKLIYNLYKLDKKNLSFGLTLYNQICNKINKTKLEQYTKILNKKLTIKPSCIKIKKLDQETIYILNNYSNNLFICDFNKNTYKWLNKI